MYFVKSTTDDKPLAPGYKTMDEAEGMLTYMQGMPGEREFNIVDENGVVQTNRVLVMSTSPGYWGRGKTIEEAVKNATWFTAGAKVRVIKVDNNAVVDGMGGLRFHAREHLGVGKLSRNKKEVTNLKPEPEL